MRHLLTFALAALGGLASAQIAPNQGLVWEPPQSGSVGMNQADTGPFGGYRTEGQVTSYMGMGSFTHKEKQTTRFYSMINAIYASDGFPDLGGAWQELLVLRQTHRVDEANKLVSITPRNVWSAEFMNGAVFGGTWQYSSAPQADINRKAFAAMKNLKSGGKANMFEIEELGRFYWVIWNSRQPSDYSTYKLGETWDWTLDEAYIMGQQSIGDFDPGEESGDLGSNVGAPGGGLDDESKSWLGSINEFIANFWDSLVGFFIPTQEDLDLVIEEFNESKLGSWFNWFFDLVEDYQAYFLAESLPYTFTMNLFFYGTAQDVVIDYSAYSTIIILIRTLLAGVLMWEAIQWWIRSLAETFSIYGIGNGENK